MVTQKLVRHLFNYDPLTGILTWKNCGRKSLIGAKAGSHRKDGYSNVNIFGKYYRVHRIAYLHFHGVLPKIVDHKDRNPSNNKISNLRAATRTQNNVNKKSLTRHGLKGISRQKNGRWQASIRKYGKRYSLGTFDTPEEAHAAYCAKGQELFGSFFCSG